MRFSNNKLDSNKVITKALINLKNQIDITNECLGNVLDVDSDAAENLIPESNPITIEQRKAALLLIRVYSSVYGILGGDSKAIKHWLNTHNTHLNGIPIKLIQTPAGLSKVVKYLEATKECSM